MLESENSEERDELISNLEEGSVVKGIVKNIENKWLKRLEILNLKKQKDSKDLFYFTLTLFFIDFVNGKKWKLNNKHLKNITSVSYTHLTLPTKA